MKTSIFWKFDEINFFDGWSLFKFNNSGLVPGMALKFDNSVTKGLKLKVRKIWGIILAFGKTTEEKLEGGTGFSLT